MSDPNPYAPPEADPGGPPARARRAPRRDDLDEARERLDEHLADPENVAADLAVAGPRLRTVTIVFAVLGVAGLVAIPLAYDNAPAATAFVGILAAVFAILGVALVAVDLSLVPRGRPSSPEQALKSHLKAMAIGRFGYAWAALCPTARESTVEAPMLGEVVTGAGEFSMESEEGIKAYAQTFARPGEGHLRAMGIKRVRVGRVDDDVAVIEVDLGFQSWPRWVSIVMIVGFVLFRPAIIVGAILYFVVRKRHEVTVSRTLLRGRDGAWYVLDANLLEGAD